ncbi:pentapeptide repeat-containing protein [Streptacidiphilus cavernicola]|uniref:Pentapeptide repeat-containing protein n=1 Tax=Streptacidiphilus cavernicola TaxID=3342716 RepID=A0ABV6W3H1_9ACTN
MPENHPAGPIDPAAPTLEPAPAPTPASAQTPAPADELRADCANCFALCCVVPAFAASVDFAVDKAAGRPCANLRRDDFACGIHADLRERGFRGCTVYDCFGAGQKVSQVTFGGRDWRQHPGTARQMFEVFPIMRDLQELLRYLTEAHSLPTARGLRPALAAALERTRALTLRRPDDLRRTDLPGFRAEVNALLLRASELARAETSGRRRRDHRGADLIGAKLRGADLRGANLRGAYLIGADLRGADLRNADVIGVDFRDADLGGADLTGALFLVQAQLDAAVGDGATVLPPTLTRPAHWPGADTAVSPGRG